MNRQILSGRYQNVLMGNEELRLGVAVALIDPRGRILLELRSDVEMWGITGGRLDVGESPIDCGIREILEETGVVVCEHQMHLVGVYGEIDDMRVLQYPERRVHLVDLMYEVDIEAEPELVLSDESLELRFFGAGEIPEELVPPSKKPIEHLIARGRLK